MALLTRRGALLAAGGAGLALSGCEKLVMGDKLTGEPAFQHVLAQAQAWTLASQRFLLGGGAMAKEYTPADLSPRFKANGTLHPSGEDYAGHVASGFADWRLRIDGLVSRPLSLSVDELRRLPARSQITRHDCVEGWSAIGGWTGAPLGLLLRAAGADPNARYVAFYCADNLDGEPSKGGEQAPGQYYESLAMVDAVHPQTIVAYAMNGRPLEIAHGAPLRLRVERQLGYKHAKYLQRIEVRSTLAGLNGGRGGYWEDRGYEWYAGILTVRLAVAPGARAASAALAVCAVASASAPTGAQEREACVGAPAGVRLRLDATQVQAATGKVVFTVYPDDPARFLAPKGKLARVRLAARAPVTAACFELPAPGRYAVAVYHDSNGDDRFGRTLVGLPAEGYGFSNDAPTATGLPALTAARVSVPAGETTLRIRMRYPR